MKRYILGLFIVAMLAFLPMSMNAQGRGNGKGNGNNGKGNSADQNPGRGNGNGNGNAGNPNKGNGNQGNQGNGQGNQGNNGGGKGVVKGDDGVDVDINHGNPGKPGKGTPAWQDPDHPGQGHAYGHYKGSLTGREFGQLRAADARNKDKVETDRVVLQETETVVVSTKDKIKALTIKVEDQYDRGEIDQTRYESLKEQIKGFEERAEYIADEVELQTRLAKARMEALIGN